MVFLLDDIKEFKKESYLNNFILIIFILMPIFLIIGTMVSEIAVIISCFIFLYNFFKNKENIFNDNLFYFFLLIYFSLIVNFIYSINPTNSFLRNIFFIKYIIFCLGSVKFLSNKKYRLFFIFKLWSIILILFSIDLFIQYFLGKNIIGLESPLKFHRVSGFMGDELKAGSLILNIALISSAYIINTKNKNLGFVFLIFFLSSIFITGDRSNFLKSIIIIISLFFIFDRTYIKKISLLFLLLTFFISLTLTTNPVYKIRYGNDLFGLLKNNNYNLIKYVYNTEYGKLYYTGYELFINNQLFGVGNKNFRALCDKKFTEKLIRDFSEKKENLRCNTHPHQVYFEIMSEHGILGLIILLVMLTIFIKDNLGFIYKKKNLLLTLQFLIILSVFIPILPGGSFFTSFNATLFWINFSFFYAYKRILIKNV
jgi:O-antigen ligase